MTPLRDAPLLALTSITKRYTTGEETIVVLDNISFALNNGESCAVIGPSGSGKTTLLSVAAGLDLPSHGTVQLCGVDLNDLSEDRKAILRRERVGFVFQSFHLIPTLTALENVLLPLELSGVKSPDRALELLAQFGLTHRTHHYPSQLSGGEQQRVTLARAFVNSPKILFADEPTGNLDRENAQRAIDGMMRLNRESHTALLLVTHDVELAAQMDRMVEIREGRLVGQGMRAEQELRSTP
jgi:putative ABC transport system ATP-binding protein